MIWKDRLSATSTSISSPSFSSSASTTDEGSWIANQIDSLLYCVCVKNAHTTPNATPFETIKEVIENACEGINFIGNEELIDRINVNQKFYLLRVCLIMVRRNYSLQRRLPDITMTKLKKAANMSQLISILLFSTGKNIFNFFLILSHSFPIFPIHHSSICLFISVHFRLCQRRKIKNIIMSYQ